MRARRSLWELWPIILHPRYMLLPMDHRPEIKGAVGASRGPAHLKEVMVRAIDTWVIVGTLSLSVVVGGFMAFVPSAETQTLYDQLLVLFGLLECMFALAGPVALGSVLAVCSSCCSDGNYDLFAEAAAPAFWWFEFQTVCMMYTLSTCIMLLVPVKLANRELLPDRLAILETHEASIALMLGVIGPVVVVTVLQINLASSVVFNGMLISDARACRAHPWDFRDPRHGSARATVVDTVVSTALRHPEPSVALQRYSALRLGASKGGKLAKDALQYALQLAHMRTNASDEVAKMEAAACVIQHHYRRWSERSGR